jgi:C-methyltransferase C-terminal domain
VHRAGLRRRPACVALLCRAGVDRSLLPAVADASPAQQGRRMPATDIPVIAPAEVAAARPDAVVLSLSDLLPGDAGDAARRRGRRARWVDAEALGPTPSL